MDHVTQYSTQLTSGPKLTKETPPKNSFIDAIYIERFYCCGVNNVYLKEHFIIVAVLMQYCSCCSKKGQLLLDMRSEPANRCKGEGEQNS